MAQSSAYACLRYPRKWETLPTDHLSTALAARALKEAALLTEQPLAADARAKRVGIDDAIAVYLSNTAATRKHRTTAVEKLLPWKMKAPISAEVFDQHNIAAQII
jgi:hypothetical protein